MSWLPTLTCHRCGADVVLRVTTDFSDPDGFDTGGSVIDSSALATCTGEDAHEFGRGWYRGRSGRHSSHEIFNRWVQRYCPDWKANYRARRREIDAELAEA